MNQFFINLAYGLPSKSGPQNVDDYFSFDVIEFENWLSALREHSPESSAIADHVEHSLKKNINKAKKTNGRISEVLLVRALGGTIRYSKQNAFNTTHKELINTWNTLLIDIWRIHYEVVVDSKKFKKPKIVATNLTNIFLYSAFLPTPGKFSNSQFLKTNFESMDFGKWEEEVTYPSYKTWQKCQSNLAFRNLKLGEIRKLAVPYNSTVKVKANCSFGELMCPILVSSVFLNAIRTWEGIGLEVLAELINIFLDLDLSDTSLSDMGELQDYLSSGMDKGQAILKFIDDTGDELPQGKAS